MQWIVSQKHFNNEIYTNIYAIMNDFDGYEWAIWYFKASRDFGSHFIKFWVTSLIGHRSCVMKTHQTHWKVFKMK